MEDSLAKTKMDPNRATRALNSLSSLRLKNSLKSLRLKSPRAKVAMYPSRNPFWMSAQHQQTTFAM